MLLFVFVFLVTLTVAMLVFAVITIGPTMIEAIQDGIREWKELFRK